MKIVCFVLALGSGLFQFTAASASDPVAAATSDVEIIQQKDLVYGRVLGAGLLADIAYPKSTTKIPAILSMHGGRWFRGTKNDNGAINVEQWAKLGLAVEQIVAPAMF